MHQPSCSDALYAARCVADHALQAGVLSLRVYHRPVCQHMGVVLADSILQAGLNYATVVKPRIASILENYPHASTLGVLIEIVETEGTSTFLQWKHAEKVSRFDSLVRFVADVQIENTFELREALLNEEFRQDIRCVRGIGPKTVDYMACLVGIDSIAVDRHVRNFAKIVGLQHESYDFLRDVFCFAADLLDVSRREFDAQLWSHQAINIREQHCFEFDVTYS